MSVFTPVEKNEMPNLKTRQKIGAALVMFVIIFVFIELLMGGEPRTLKVPAGLVELRLPPTTASADVTWEAREPITQQFKTYENGTVLVTYLASGQVVFSSDIIDWDARTRDKTTWIVQVEGPAPPKPPGPNPPDPTVPPSGLAGEIFNKAKAINEPAKSLKYAQNYETVVAEIGAGALQQLPAIQARIVELNTPLASNSQAWKDLGQFIASKLPGDVAGVKAVFEQVAVGLRAAGGGQ